MDERKRAIFQPQRGLLQGLFRSSAASFMRRVYVATARYAHEPFTIDYVVAAQTRPQRFGREAMTIPKVCLAARVNPNVLQHVAREASRRGVSQSAVVEQILDKHFRPEDDLQLHLLRSVFIIRELIWDMSARNEKEKEDLWQSMTDFARKLQLRNGCGDTLESSG